MSKDDKKDKLLPLTERQLKACDNYIKHTLVEPLDGFTWPKAMKYKGLYSKDYTARYASKIFKQENIQVYLESKRGEIEQNTNITAYECIINIRYGIDKSKEADNLKSLASFTKLLVDICPELKTIGDNKAIVQINTTDTDEIKQLKDRLKRLEAVENAPDAIYTE